MNCPRHSRKKVVGYCKVCGDLGCEECLTLHENNLYCERHYRPIAEALERQKRRKESRGRQRLVVHTRDGKVAYGVCHAMNPNTDGFHLELVDRKGEPRNKSAYLNFSDLKAVFYVRSFDGRFEPESAEREFSPQGDAIVVEFEDGEFIPGRTLKPLRKGEARFLLIPDDVESNNMGILLDGSAVKRLYSPDEFEQEQQQRIEQYLKDHTGQGVTRKERVGDYYFEKKDYSQALTYYRNTRLEHGNNSRINKKIVTVKHNLALRAVKQRNYRRAFDLLERALKLDPGNEKAKELYNQLLAHIEKKKHARA